jgi:hypothetical protein
MVCGLVAFSCSVHVPLDHSGLSDVHRLAVVVRVLSKPGLDWPGALPEGLTKKAMLQKVSSAMSDFELAERIRSSMQQHLPGTPPFNDVAPTVQVETVLGSLLVAEDKTVGPPSFQELQRINVDGVLYIEVDNWGVRPDAAEAGPKPKPHYFLHGMGRLFTLPGDSTLWRGQIDMQGPDEGLSVDSFETGQVRNLLGDLCNRAGTAVAIELGGTAEINGHTTETYQPDIPDEGHPPEKRAPVLPFVYDFDAGVPDAGATKAHAASADAGDPLFPGPILQ